MKKVEWLASIFIREGVQENEIDACIEWCFGTKGQNLLLQQAPERYNSLHPECDPVSIGQSVESGTAMMVKAWKARGGK